MKVLKVVGVAAAIGATVLSGGILAPATVAALAGAGVTAGLLTAVALGTSIGASLLRGGKGGAAVTSSNIDRLRASIDPRTPRKSAIGITAMTTDVR